MDSKRRYIRVEPHAVTTISDFESNNRLPQSDLLGSGSYGTVYRGYDTVNRTFVALKILKTNDTTEGFSSFTLREIVLLNQIRHHDNIVQLLDVFPTTDNSNQEGNSREVCQMKYVLVLELVDMDLKRYMESYSGRLHPSIVQDLSKQLLTGVAYIHEAGIIHRDLKPANLLMKLNSNGQHTLKISDFGLARPVGYMPRLLTAEVVTLWYRAPELLLGCRKYDGSVDVWSVACVIIELSKKSPLFSGSDSLDQLYKIFRLLGTPITKETSPDRYEGFSPAAIKDITWPDLSDGQMFPDWKECFPMSFPREWSFIAPDLPLSGQNLVAQMLQYNPLKRITALGALNTNYFQENLALDKKSVIPPVDGGILTPPCGNFSSFHSPTTKSRPEASQHSQLVPFDGADVEYPLSYASDVNVVSKKRRFSARDAKATMTADLSSADILPSSSSSKSTSNIHLTTKNRKV